MRIKLILILLIALLFLPTTIVEAMEEDTKIVELFTVEINGFYSQEGDSPAVIYEEKNGNQYLKLSYSSGDYSTFYFDSTAAINKNGLYKFEADVRYNSDLHTDNIFIYIFGEESSTTKTIANNVNEFENYLKPIANSEWKKLTFYFTIDDYYQNFYECFKFGFNTHGDKYNFIDIDNINISIASEMEFGKDNIDVNGDFEHFEDGYQLDTPGWHNNDSLCVEERFENSIIIEEGNKVLKLYTSIHNDTNIIKSLKLDVAQEGWYKLSFNAKGGANFKTDNIGFKIFDSNGLMVNNVAVNYSKISNKKWTTIETLFYVEKNTSPEWINLTLWVYTNNAENPDAKNYLLIDDLAIYRNTSGGEFGKNLFEAGAIEEFDARKGEKIHDIHYDSLVTKYPYRKEIISVDALKEFAVGKKFIETCKEQNYFGTIGYDVSAVVVEKDGYHSVLLTYDGKQQTKTFASFSYLLDLVEMSTQKYYVLEFDYLSDVVDTDGINVSFIGNDNKDDFLIDLLNCQDGYNQTIGYNRNVYSYEIINNSNGWKHCRLVFKPDIEFKERVTALRFLLNANYNENNKLYLSNIALTEYSDTEYEEFNVDNIPEVKPQEDHLLLIIGIIVGVSLVISIPTVLFIKKRKGGK